MTEKIDVPEVKDRRRINPDTLEPVAPEEADRPWSGDPGAPSPDTHECSGMEMLAQQMKFLKKQVEELTGSESVPEWGPFFLGQTFNLNHFTVQIVDVRITSQQHVQLVVGLVKSTLKSASGSNGHSKKKHRRH